MATATRFCDISSTPMQQLAYFLPDYIGYYFLALAGIKHKKTFRLFGCQFQVTLAYPLMEGCIFILKAVLPAVAFAGEPCLYRQVQQNCQIRMQSLGSGIFIRGSPSTCACRSSISRRTPCMLTRS